MSILRDDGVPIGLSLHECMLMAAVFSAADEVATLSLIKQVRPQVQSAVLSNGTLISGMSSIAAPKSLGANVFFYAIPVSNSGSAPYSGTYTSWRTADCSTDVGESIITCNSPPNLLTPLVGCCCRSSGRCVAKCTGVGSPRLSQHRRGV